MSVVMTSRFLPPFTALVLSLAIAQPAAAANKEHQQLMADLRMLQEQTQLLQNALGTLTEALKAVNTRLDQQSDANRRYKLLDSPLLTWALVEFAVPE